MLSFTREHAGWSLLAPQIKSPSTLKNFNLSYSNNFLTERFKKVLHITKLAALTTPTKPTLFISEPNRLSRLFIQSESPSMPGLFLFFSLLSGLFGLSYEIIYQRIFLTICGDLFGTYVVVVSTFIIGMALGNICGARLRNHLPLLEICSGAFAIFLAVGLRHGLYLVYIPLPVMIALLLVPAFAIGTSLPLYSYYYRIVQFKNIYAVYHLGAVLAILLAEFYLLPLFAQSTVLMAIGVFHVLMGVVIYLLYQRGIFQITKLQKQPICLVEGITTKTILALFIFSLFSFFYHFWALKAIFYTLLPLRMISSVAIASGLFWIFIGTLAASLRFAKTFSPIAFYFVLHITAIILVIPYLSEALPLILTFGPRIAFCIIIFFYMSPCLWPTLYAVSVIHSIRSENMDVRSGSVLFICGLGNVSGFVLGLWFGRLVDKTEYFIPFIVFLAMALSAVLFSFNRKKRVMHSSLCGALCLLVAFFIHQGLYPTSLYQHISVFNTKLMSCIDYSKELLNSEPLFRTRLKNLTFLISELNETQDLAEIYPSAQATISLVPNYLRNAINEDNPTKNPIKTSYEPFDLHDKSFAIEGYHSHFLFTPNEYKVGFIPRLYFQEKIANSLVIGVGSGETSSGVAMNSKHTDIIDVSEHVFSLLDRLAEVNAGVKHRSNVHTIQNDAMLYLKQESHKYEAIINTSSPHYTVWAAKLYSTEFLDLVKNNLAPNGVYITWVDIISMTNRQSVLSYIGYLKKHFNYVDAHYISQGYLVIAAYDIDRSLTPFDYTDFLESDLNFFTLHPELRPQPSDINSSYIRYVKADNVLPMDSTLDKPTIEQNAVDNLFKFIFNEDAVSDYFSLK